MPGMDLGGRRVVVVGLGRTGEATAEFLLDRGAKVWATDIRTAEQLGPAVEKLAARGVRLELGSHNEKTLNGADLIVLSPGVPPYIGPLAKARAGGVPVTGEIELASMFIDAPMAAVTGTNGKTTTTELIGAMLAAGGGDVFVGGNIGRPLIELVLSGKKPEAVVVEVSSFQLETVRNFKPKAAVLLNVTPDHLDRYKDFDDYYRAKLKIFARQEYNDFAILNADDRLSAEAPVAARRLTFSRLGRRENSAFIDGPRIVLTDREREIGTIELEALKLTGAHNHENIMAALLAVRAMEGDLEKALEVAADFTGLPHRMEYLGELDGVRYFDDSKGTNEGAVIKSLQSFDNPVVLIAGGRNKDSDFAQLKGLVGKKVKLLILMGEAASLMAGVLGRETETVMASDMEEAVKLAKNAAVSGDTVLLSPGCASFDMFEDYAHRGRVFAEQVGKAVKN